LVAIAQQLGWARVGHALAVIAGPVGQAARLAVEVGWPFLLAFVISLLVSVRGREILFEIARGAHSGMTTGRWPAVVIAAVGVTGLLIVVIVAAPPWFVHDRSLEGLKAQNQVRTTLLQGFGGMVLLAGAYVTYRQLTNSREQLQIAQQGQITERFTRAIDQLGHAQLDVRLAGSTPWSGSHAIHLQTAPRSVRC
jgi:hypothetical protein